MLKKQGITLPPPIVQGQLHALTSYSNDDRIEINDCKSYETDDLIFNFNRIKFYKILYSFIKFYKIL